MRDSAECKHQYMSSLDVEVEARYKKKLEGIDPFAGCDMELTDAIPPVEATDIIAYLLESCKLES